MKKNKILKHVLNIVGGSLIGLGLLIFLIGFGIRGSYGMTFLTYLKETWTILLLSVLGIIILYSNKKVFSN